MTETMTANEASSGATGPPARKLSGGPSRLAKYRHSQQDRDKAKRKNKVGASLNELSLDDEEDYFLSHSSDDNMDDLIGTRSANRRVAPRTRRPRPPAGVVKKKVRSKSHMDALDEGLAVTASFSPGKNRDVLTAQSDHIPKKTTSTSPISKDRSTPSPQTEHVRGSDPYDPLVGAGLSEHSRASTSRKKSSPSDRRHARSDSAEDCSYVQGTDDSYRNTHHYNDGDDHMEDSHRLARVLPDDDGYGDYEQDIEERAQLQDPQQYTETLKDEPSFVPASGSQHSRSTTRRRTSPSNHSRCDSINSASDAGNTSISNDDSSTRHSKRSTRKTRSKSTRNKSTSSKKGAGDIDGYGSDHGMKRRTKKVREKDAMSASSHQKALDGYGSDHGMKQRVKNSRTDRKNSGSHKPAEVSSRHERRIKNNQDVDGYGSDHGMKRRVQRTNRAERKAGGKASDEDDADLTKTLQRQNSSGRLSRFLDLIPGRSKRRLGDDSKSVGGQETAPPKEKSERKRSSSIGAMARRLGRRSERRTKNDRSSDETSRDQAIEHVRSPPRRHKSMDAGHVAAAPHNIHPPEFEDDDENGRASHAPVRTQSVMMHRERTRRGKSDSLHNLQEYKAEELPSTSYFASNHILLNRERMKRGMKPLTRNRAMDELAREHAEKMAKSAGCTPLKATFIGNVVRGESIRAIHKAIMQNREGRERYNILNPYFQEFGIGTCKGDDGMLYVCQLFSESIELACVDT